MGTYQRRPPERGEVVLKAPNMIPRLEEMYIVAIERGSKDRHGENRR